MKHKLDEASTHKPRKRVCIYPNNKFAEVAEIAAAIKEAKAKAPKAATKAEEKAVKKASKYSACL